MTKSHQRLLWSTLFSVLPLGCGGLDDSNGTSSAASTSGTSSSTSTTGSSTSASSSSTGATSTSATATSGTTGATSTTDVTSSTTGTSGGGGASGSTSGAGGATTSSTAGSGTGGQTTGGSGGSSGGPEGGAPEAGADASRVDAGTSGPSAGCTGIAGKFCDDFEGQTAGQAPTGDFTVSAKAGALIVDTTKAHSGTKAIHIKTAKPGATSMLVFSKQFPTNDYHGRAMFFVASQPTNIHWDIVYSYSQNNVQWEIGGMYQKFMFVVDPPDHALTSITFPINKWFCLQWEFKYGGADAGTSKNSFLAKMDNAVLDKGQFTGPDPSGATWNAGPWRNLNIGWTGYGSGDTDIEMWVDDIAFGDTPIACPAP